MCCFLFIFSVLIPFYLADRRESYNNNNNNNNTVRLYTGKNQFHSLSCCSRETGHPLGWTTDSPSSFSSVRYSPSKSQILTVYGCQCGKRLPLEWSSGSRLHHSVSSDFQQQSASPPVCHSVVQSRLIQTSTSVPSTSTRSNTCLIFSLGNYCFNLLLRSYSNYVFFIVVCSWTNPEFPLRRFTDTVSSKGCYHHTFCSLSSGKRGPAARCCLISSPKRTVVATLLGMAGDDVGMCFLHQKATGRETRGAKCEELTADHAREKEIQLVKLEAKKEIELISIAAQVSSSTSTPDNSVGKQGLPQYQDGEDIASYLVRLERVAELRSIDKDSFVV